MKQLIFGLLFFACLSQVSAQKTTFRNEFGFTSDNDAYLFYGQDRYYTNGLFLNFRHALKQPNSRSKIEKAILEISAGQKLFNPMSGYAPDPLKQDRPFAGYLYAGTSYSAFLKNQSILSFALELGVVGPSSGGKEGQEFLHKTVGFYEIAGWEYQIHDALAVNLRAQYTKLLQRAENNQTDFSFIGTAKLGTTYSGADAGILFRAGTINPLSNSASAHARISANEDGLMPVANEFFFYAQPMVQYVAYDATVKGSLFNNDSPVTFDVKPIVFSQILGVTYATRRFTFDYHMQFNSKEIKSKAKPHQFGSLSAFYRFN